MVEYKKQNADQLKAKVAVVAKTVPRRSLWRHKRTRNLYRVESVALAPKTLEPMVVYYATDNIDVMWVRSAGDFVLRFDEAPHG